MDKPKIEFSNEHDHNQEAFDDFWKDTIYAGCFLVAFALALMLTFEVFFN